MESIALSESAGDSAQLCQLYINAAAAYTQAGRYDEAEKYLLYARPLLSNIERCGISGCSMPLCTIEREPLK